ncbi:MAG: cytochrome P450, partial [Actinobacteria bacterium]|nr:cytochrome P450 [Actinomycetota bacterium]MCA1722269.1 cytochrome P450 [Actinomycetota bacterium]
MTARLRAQEPVAWAPAMDRWLVSRHDLVLSVVDDTASFVSDHPRSLIRSTFGPQMLSADGAEQRRHRGPYAAAFRPRYLRTTATASVQARAAAVVSSLAPGDELTVPAAQMAVGTVLDVLGLSDVADVATVSAWYADLAAALANVSNDAVVAERGRQAAQGFAAALTGAHDPGSGHGDLSPAEHVS